MWKVNINQGKEYDVGQYKTFTFRLIYIGIGDIFCYWRVTRILFLFEGMEPDIFGRSRQRRTEMSDKVSLIN